jgi:hypothetical protein
VGRRPFRSSCALLFACAARIFRVTLSFTTALGRQRGPNDPSAHYHRHRLSRVGSSRLSHRNSMVSNNVAWAIGKGYRAFQHEDVFRHRRLGHRDVPDCEISLTPGATSPRPWSAGACSRFSTRGKGGRAILPNPGIAHKPPRINSFRTLPINTGEGAKLQRNAPLGKPDSLWFPAAPPLLVTPVHPLRYFSSAPYFVT